MTPWQMCVSAGAVVATLTACVRSASDDPGSLASRAPAGTSGLIKDASCEADPGDCSDAAAAANNSLGIVAKEVLRPIRLSRVDGRGVDQARMLLTAATRGPSRTRTASWPGKVSA